MVLDSVTSTPQWIRHTRCNVTGVVTGVVKLSDLNRGVRDPRAVKKNCTEGCKRNFVLPVQFRRETNP
jgi:hypothetical protein